MVLRQISIWQNCDPGVRAAVERFIDRSGPFSLASKRYSFLRLIREELDEALAVYRDQLELKYMLFRVPGLCGQQPLSRIVNDVGVRATEDEVRRALRRFVDSMICEQDKADVHFIDTAETLVEVLVHCRCKQPRRKKSTASHLNLQRPKELCCLCGEPSEYLQYFGDPDAWDLVDEEEKQRLSHKYCHRHRPRFRDGTWNYEYRKAMRNREVFDLEASRLLRQSAQPAEVKPHTGKLDVDLFIMNLIAQTTLQPADENKIRNLARRLVNYRISDRKKQILMLSASGFKQADIARRLGVSRQAVSKTLASIPDEFRFDVS